MCRVIAVASQKGGVGKTTTAGNIGIGLVRKGKKVLIIDCDAQGSLSTSLGISEPDELDNSLATTIEHIINEDDFDLHEGFYKHSEGVDVLPANIELSGVELSLISLMSRELVLREYIEQIKKEYDYVIIDCMPSLGMITVNALACADSVIIPVQAAYLPAKGLSQLIKTIGKIKRQVNPKLEIEGILLTMVDTRTNYAKDTIEKIRSTYGDRIRIFESQIPFSVRAAEIAAEGVSIFIHEPKGKVAKAYESLTSEIIREDDYRGRWL